MAAVLPEKFLQLLPFETCALERSVDRIDEQNCLQWRIVRFAGLAGGAKGENRLRLFVVERVKSCCCRPGTGLPDLSVTTTSSEMGRPGPPRGCAVALSAGVTGGGSVLCWENAGNEKQQRKTINNGFA
jgi:hypothetical protein